MQSHQSRGGYSAFFFSGYRAICSRCPSEKPLATAPPTYSFPGRRHSLKKDSKPSPLSSTLRPPSSSKTSRRNSVVEFFGKLSMSSSNAQKCKRESRRHSSFIEADAWSTAATSPKRARTTSARTRAEPSPQYHSIDPFSASPQSSSFFIDLDLTDSPSYFMGSPGSPRSNRTKRFSFLSLSSSSNDNTPSRRDRPTSIHTLPRSSVYSVSSYAEKLERFADELSEELEEITLSDEWSDGDSSDGGSDPGTLDWRQFHLDLMDDTAEQ
ncbi:hypothetical protein AAF712_004954 [Marasmius tenuissimus]|uniref:Uncharacterized protein n=1 Tax=Marasmius tenuissimus TaxID=585030 RepID=A0ABR3A2F2_9AGAR